MPTYDPTQPRPFEHLVDLVGLQAAGDMLEAAAPAVAEAGADIQQTGAILLAAMQGLNRSPVTVAAALSQVRDRILAYAPLTEDSTCEEIAQFSVDEVAAELGITLTRPKETPGGDAR